MISDELSFRSRSLLDWLQYIEACHPSRIDLGLARISQVAKRLEVLNFNCPVVTVAGTNGKGSNVSLIAAILGAAGYRVGTYTSPHLIHYQERIQIAGQNISDQDLCRSFSLIEENRDGISLTYFEFGTLAALLTFSAVAACKLAILACRLAFSNC